MRPRLDIAVAGAGPGGLAAALALHRQGHRLVIYDQFESPRPLGSGLILQPTGLEVLDWLGLGERMRSLGARIDRLYGASSRTGRTVLDVRYAALGPERGCAVHRAALFNVLHDAVAEAGISIETSSPINGFDDGVLMLHEGRRSPRFDLVIDAAGSHSPLRKHTGGDVAITPLAYGAFWASLPWPGNGFDPHALEQRYDRASVMAGVLPIGRVTPDGPQQAAFFWSLKDADRAAWASSGLQAWKDSVLRHWPETETLLNGINDAGQLTFARYQHHTNPQPHGRKLISIGDSVHATSPQLGQGANMALLDVMALAMAMEQHDDLEQAAHAYAASRSFHVRVYQALSLAFTPFYQSDSKFLPMLRDDIVAPLSRLSIVQRLLAKMVAGRFVRPLRIKGLQDRD